MQHFCRIEPPSSPFSLFSSLLPFTSLSPLPSFFLYRLSPSSLFAICSCSPLLLFTSFYSLPPPFLLIFFLASNAPPCFLNISSPFLPSSLQLFLLSFLFCLLLFLLLCSLAALLFAFSSPLFISSSFFLLHSSSPVASSYSSSLLPRGTRGSFLSKGHQKTPTSCWFLTPSGHISPSLVIQLLNTHKHTHTCARAGSSSGCWAWINNHSK